MNPQIRSLLVAVALATFLVACGASANPIPSDAPSAPAEPSAPPSEPVPSDPPSQPPPSQRPSQAPAPSQPGARVPSGTLTAGDGAVVDGPGVALSEALAGDLSNAILVRGVVFRDADGAVWMADAVLDASVPSFSDARVRVANYPTYGPTWDMADADIKGLQEVNGIRFFDDTKLYGTITP